MRAELLIKTSNYTPSEAEIISVEPKNQQAARALYGGPTDPILEEQETVQFSDADEAGCKRQGNYRATLPRPAEAPPDRAQALQSIDALVALRNWNSHKRSAAQVQDLMLQLDEKTLVATLLRRSFKAIFGVNIHQAEQPFPISDT